MDIFSDQNRLSTSHQKREVISQKRIVQKVNFSGENYSQMYNTESSMSCKKNNCIN